MPERTDASITRESYANLATRVSVLEEKVRYFATTAARLERRVDELRNNVDGNRDTLAQLIQRDEDQ